MNRGSRPFDHSDQTVWATKPLRHRPACRHPARVCGGTSNSRCRDKLQEPFGAAVAAPNGGFRRGCACRREPFSRTTARGRRSMGSASACGHPRADASWQRDAPRAASASASATSSADSGFPAARRLRRRSEFQAVYHKGVRLGGRHFNVFALRTRTGASSRVGLTVTRKIGPAVTRNRCKRLLREAVRRHWSEFPEGLDVVLHAKPALGGARADEVEREVVRLLPRIARRAA